MISYGMKILKGLKSTFDRFFGVLDVIGRRVFNNKVREKCAELSLIAFIAGVPFGVLCLVRAHKAPSGMNGLYDILDFVMIYPIVSWIWSGAALMACLGKHEKKRIAVVSFLGTLLSPVLIIGSYVLCSECL